MPRKKKVRGKHSPLKFVPRSKRFSEEVFDLWKPPEEWEATKYKYYIESIVEIVVNWGFDSLSNQTRIVKPVITGFDERPTRKQVEDRIMKAIEQMAYAEIKDVEQIPYDEAIMIDILDVKILPIKAFRGKFYAPRK